MKLKNTFLVHVSEGENMLVPAAGAGFEGIIRGNKTFGEILKLLQAETNEEQIRAALEEKYQDPDAKDRIARDVAKAIQELRKVGALDE